MTAGSQTTSTRDVVGTTSRAVDLCLKDESIFNTKNKLMTNVLYST
jgi:hypothetical protein